MCFQAQHLLVAWTNGGLSTLCRDGVGPAAHTSSMLEAAPMVAMCRQYPPWRTRAGDGGRRGGRGRNVAGWMEGHQGWLTTVLSCGGGEQEKGRRRDLLGEDAQGDYEPEAALVELGVGCERARRKGSFGLGRPCPRAQAATREEERAAQREKGA
jgi:hypothetical protein